MRLVVGQLFQGENDIETQCLYMRTGNGIKGIPGWGVSVKRPGEGNGNFAGA